MIFQSEKLFSQKINNKSSATYFFASTLLLNKDSKNIKVDALLSDVHVSFSYMHS